MQQQLFLKRKKVLLARVTCVIHQRALEQKQPSNMCVSPFPRRIFGPIRPVPAVLWHSNVPGGDGNGTVHLARVHHLLEVLLSLV